MQKKCLSKGTAHYLAGDIKVPRKPEWTSKSRIAAAKANKQKYADLREAYKKAGFEQARVDPLFCLIAMLHWGEGSKGRNTFSIANCDARMLQLVANWLNKNNYLWIFKCHYHPGNGLSEKEITAFWKKKLSISDDQFRKFTKSKHTDKHGNKKGKQPYGCGAIEVYSTKLQQMFLGSYDYFVMKYK